MLAFMKLLIQSRCVLLACICALPALMVRRVQGVLQLELLFLLELQVVRIYFKYNYI